jgi:putative chitobiose transport system permease protein
MTKKFSLTPYLFLSPALLAIAVFVLYPILAVIYYSFTSYDIVRPAQWIGLQNYIKLAHDATFWLALRNSFLYLIVTPTLIVLSIILAIIVNRNLPGIAMFRALYYVPAVSGSIAIGIAWRWIFDAQGGLLNGFLLWLGLLKEPVQWLGEPAYTLPIAMLLTTWMGLGYYALIFLAGLQNIPEELYDAALIDGCNNFQKHWYVSLPGLRPQIVLVAVISSLAAIEVFNEVFILTNRTGGVLDSGMTMVFYIWRNAFKFSNAGYGSAIALVLLVITLAFSIVNIRLQERGQEERD